MFRAGYHLISTSHFEEPSLVKYPDIIAQMMADCKIVRHHQQTEAEVLFQSAYEIHHLRPLHGIKPFRQAVTNQQFRSGPVSYTHLTLPTSDLV